jgi:predicted ATPase/DNA-binding SARP family transcriptional activator
VRELEFRLLGPLEVLAGGNRVPIPGAKERSLLALLLLHAGRVVSADRLLEELWGEHLPDDPANALQSRVAKLRRALGQTGAHGLLASRRPGYVLEVAPEQLDIHRFERLLAKAREAAGTIDAANRFEEALALWRGPALADFAHEGFAQAEIGRLEELRLVAVEGRLDAELAAGHHAELVGQLEALVAAHPLRERFRAQLMAALYRSGRQADALAAYRAARTVLADELGIDPSPELQQLERAILTQDPSLAAPEPLAGPPGNLPARLTSFVGRRTELERVQQLLADQRLVTLTGPGGVGKTSLALAAAAQAAGRYRGGVWLVELAALGDPFLVPTAVAAALGLRDTLGGPGGQAPMPPLDRLVQFVQAGERLLVLDNCEHLIQACAELAEALLGAAPTLRILATSRERLGVPGEALWPVAPLELPDQALPPGALAGYDVVRLFVERAVAVRPDFALDAATAPAVARICRRLDGLPLAVELAAARVRSLPVSEIADRLDDRFGLLTGGPRTAAPRQQTLQATLDWSYRLLGEPERRLFGRLAVFAGGWTLEAAEAVCAGDGIAASQTVDLLGRLVDQSLVVAEPGETARYRMLESARDYARDRLVASGEADTVARRQLDYLVGLAERAGPQLRGAEQARWMARLEAEHDNLRAALDWALGHEVQTGLRLAGTLAWYWLFGHQQEGRRWLARALAAADDHPTLERARGLLAVALVDAFHPTTQSLAAARQSLEIFQALGHRREAALAEAIVALEHMRAGDFAHVRALLDEAEQTFAEVGDRWGEALTWLVRTSLHAHLGERSHALEAGQRSLAGFRAIGDRYGTSVMLWQLGTLLGRGGDHQAAAALFEEALGLARTMRLSYVVGSALAELASLAATLGDLERADALYVEALALARATGSKGAIAACYDGLGTVARRRGDRQRALELHRQALELYRGLGHQPGMVAALCHLGMVEEALGNLDAAETYHREGLAIARQTGHQREALLGLEGQAGVAAARGDAGRAALLLGAAAALREQLGVPSQAADAVDTSRVADRARASLGEQAFADTLEQGRTLDAGAAIRLALA